ncbi:MAG: PQQ-binding-like beta-propeller repeat protein [Planctomycetes bacterium]|nr:PQQ-binding-like beta-propeller repeat protein [Planctomycetota bacterium]
MQYRAVMLSLACAVGCLLPGNLPAQEWTRFRGPNGTGISDATTIPVKWSENDYNWKIELPGVGHSSPVLWGNKLFVMSALEDSATRIVLCINADDGSTLWSKEFASAVHNKHVLNSFASPTPAVDADHVYVCWSTPDEYTLMAFDHSGNLVWKRDLGQFTSQHSCGTSPIVYQDLVILGNDQDGPSYLIAVNRKTGETVWQKPRETAVVAYSTPCIYQPPGKPAELIFNSQAHGVTSLDPLTGKTNWELKGVFDKRSVSSPVIVSGLIIGSCGSGAGGGDYVAAVRPGTIDPSGQPKEVWRMTKAKATPYVPTMVAKGELLFLFGKGIVTCMKGATGEEIWQKSIGGNFFGSPVCVNDRLYCMREDGECLVLAATDKYELLGSTPLGDSSRSTPAVAKASTLAEWIESKPDTWWSVDGDPLLTSIVDFPCPSDELAPAIRRIGATLVLQDKDDKSTASGEQVNADRLDDLSDTNNKSRQKTLLLSWKDSDTDWLLMEDEPLTEP